MKLFRKIDTITGNFLEDVLFESHPFLVETVQEEITFKDGTTEILVTEQPLLDAEGNTQFDPQYVEEAPPQGLYLPRYLNGVWIEGGVAPEPAPQVLSEAERIEMLENTLLLLMME